MDMEGRYVPWRRWAGTAEQVWITVNDERLGGLWGRFRVLESFVA